MTSDTAPIHPIFAPINKVVVPSESELTQRAERSMKFITALQIASAEDYGFAADELKAIKRKANALEEQRTAITGPMNKALKALNDLFRGPAAMLSNAEALLKGKMLEWDDEQRRIADEARRVAEQVAALERKKLADEAAARQAEAQALIKAAEAARESGNVQAEGLATTAALRAQAEAQTAVALSDMIVAPAVATPASVSGITTSSKLDAQVVDMLKLISYIANERPELINLVTADSIKLRAYVRGVGAACDLPGVLVKRERILSARAA